MKKILIIGCGLIFSALTAENLHHDVHLFDPKFVEPQKEFVYSLNSAFMQETILVCDYVNEDVDVSFAFEKSNENPKFQDILFVDTEKRKGFYKTIDYESVFNEVPIADKSSIKECRKSINSLNRNWLF